MLFARALFYVITLRGLMAVVAGAAGDLRRSGSAGYWARGGGNPRDEPDGVTEVTEAAGGPAAEPGEWEGNAPVAAPLASRASPLADRGLLLLLLLLHKRVRYVPGGRSAEGLVFVSGLTLSLKRVCGSPVVVVKGFVVDLPRGAAGRGDGFPIQLP